MSLLHPDAAVAEAEDGLFRPYDTSDPAQVNAARIKHGRKSAEKRSVLAGLMDEAEGRAWMCGLLADCHVFETSFIQGDPNASAFREGERNMGIRLLADIMRVAPDQYVKMLKENK